MATILLVEDQADIRTLLRAVVEREGHMVLEAADVASARVLAEQGPQLLLTDVSLPGESGLDLVRSLRARPELRDLPVVLVTAHADMAAEAAARLGGTVEVILKPFRFDQVAGILRQILATDR